MVLVPWLALTFLSPLSPSEVGERLGARTRPPGARGAPRAAGAGKFLEGSIEGRLFRVWPANQRWSAVVARGDVREDPAGSRIHLTVRPSMVGTIFLVLWLGGAFAAALAVMVVGQREGSVPPNLLAVWILPVVGWALIASAMRREGARMARVLGELLGAAPAAPGARGARR